MGGLLGVPYTLVHVFLLVNVTYMRRWTPCISDVSVTTLFYVLKAHPCVPLKEDFREIPGSLRTSEFTEG